MCVSIFFQNADWCRQTIPVIDDPVCEQMSYGRNVT